MVQRAIKYFNGYVNWTVFIAACTLILALMTVIVVTVLMIVDLKLELTKKDARIFILENQHPIVSPSGYR